MRCICIADHNLDGHPVRCLHDAGKGRRKCDACRKPKAKP